MWGAELTGISPIMWYTVAARALINMLLIRLFDLRLGTHVLLVSDLVAEVDTEHGVYGTAYEHFVINRLASRNGNIAKHIGF